MVDGRRERRWAFIRRVASIVLSLGVVLPLADTQAKTYGGIEFPQGASSFADVVLVYDPYFSGGPAPTGNGFKNPGRALGIPDYTGSYDGTGAVALGHGGWLELRFTDNVLINSGGTDLVIFEVGPQAERVWVAVRPASTPTEMSLAGICADNYAPFGDGYCEIGLFAGGVFSLDLDFVFPGFSPGELRFDAVQLIDDINQGNHTGTAIGADIDAVGAVSSGDVVCGDGLVEGSEECDDGNLEPGDGCAPDCTVEFCWACAGMPSSCAPADGAPCDDGNHCTTEDYCAGLVCVGGPPLSCDDGNVCTDDSCQPDSGCVHVPNRISCDDGSSCSTGDRCSGGMCIGNGQPFAGCLPVSRSFLLVRDHELDKRDAVVWRWTDAGTPGVDNFGDPVDGSTGYEFCVFDSDGAALRLSASVLPGGVCEGDPCWRVRRGGSGFVYRDKQVRRGMKRMVLKPGQRKRTRVIVRGKGENLSMPLPLPLVLPVKVQLKATDSAACWESEYQLERRNDERRFRARSVY